MSKFEYSDTNIFNHALKKIGAWGMIGEELTGKEALVKEALKNEYERVKHHHLQDADKHVDSHPKYTKLVPYGDSHPHWFYAPDDLHDWGSTNINERHQLSDGREIVKISAIEGDVVYNAKGGRQQSEGPMSPDIAEVILRDFTLQAAIFCGVDSGIIQELRKHKDDLVQDKHTKMAHDTFVDFFKEYKKQSELKNVPASSGYSYGQTSSVAPYLNAIESVASNVISNTLNKTLGGLMGGIAGK